MKYGAVNDFVRGGKWRSEMRITETNLFAEFDNDLDVSAAIKYAEDHFQDFVKA